ncbi:hypothetical protein Celaphus_00010024 [Cervus elaphus hippelaphus]|uniref:Uncharacterized protein n=1 Tax=Cervus elaphus hippelaphus TaxID=46360 RepID=A0A212C027_CEREH|nr:hypothetical protein Celaphus_00010024 [Cervus elaphus hippelaphus]
MIRSEGDRSWTGEWRRNLSAQPHSNIQMMVAGLLDELNLLVQVVRLQEEAQVGVAAVGGQLVQVEQALVDALLQVQRILHGLETTFPLLGLGLSDIEEADAAPTPVLQEHQALCPLTVLVAAEQEEAREVLQGRIITVDVEGRGQALFWRTYEGGAGSKASDTGAVGKKLDST